MSVPFALLQFLIAGAAAAGPSVPPGADVQVMADRLSYEGETGNVLLEGNAVVRRGAVVVRARSISLDPGTNEVRAVGGVLLTDAARAISADAVRAVLGGDFEAQGVLAFIKDQPVDLSGLRTEAEAKEAGRNRLTFRGERLTGNAEGRMRLHGARVTMCDCPGGRPPSWEVTARDADIVPGKRAILRWSVLRVAPRFLLVERPVPVLALPVLYLPLGERESGALLPVLGSTGSSGFSIAEPLYLTLGRSADATLTPEYAFGRSRAQVAAGKPAVRGPGARLELRWAPAEAAEGRTEVSWIHDLDAEPGGESGDRWGLIGFHRQRLGTLTSLAAGLQLAGDRVWVRDTAPDVLGRSLPYRRSDLVLSHRAELVVGEIGASYVQPLGPALDLVPGGPPLPGAPPEPYGFLGSALGLGSRLGAAAATLPSFSAGPFTISGRLGAARFQSVNGSPLDVAERPSATRADLRAEVATPMLVAGAVTLVPYVRGAALGYAFDEIYDPRAAAWGIAGAMLETEVSRRFGGVRHAISPRLEWRTGTSTSGEELPFPSYDVMDRSNAGLLTAASGPFSQLRAAVETRLEGSRSRMLRAELSQDLDLRAGRFAESAASLSAAAGWIRADARARFLLIDSRGFPAPEPRIRSWLDDFTELRGSFSVDDGKGDGARAGFLAVGAGGSGKLVAGLDQLFDLRPSSIGASAVATAGLRASMSGAKIGYDVLLPGRAAYVPRCEGAGERRVGAFQVQQHAASLGWESPCRCFRITAVTRITDCGDVSYSASIDLSRLAGALGR